MMNGIPLDGSDRTPWLASLHKLISSNLTKGRFGVLTCSTLKKKYREQLLKGSDGVQVVYLKGSYELI